MAKGILGRKVGMTQVFDVEGELIPVTVIQITPNVVLQKKSEATDGYNAVQLGFEDKPERLANKPELGHVKKANTNPKRFIREIRDFEIDAEVGSEIAADIFVAGEIIDATGTSKGKGFQGAIKRHGQSRGPMAHGSRYHRRPGSMGAVAANRVFKGKKLPGHMGSKTVTIQNLEVVQVDLENNIILVRGNVPGAKRSLVVLSNASKAVNNKEGRSLVNYNPVVEVPAESADAPETAE
ncbi:50S ribosomal protein L3 [Culicoidibacter larvae]|uniref:Large ribosomal subunit protein uL3 n=1 Tax=Culicoidibacter larvae TaxID=2579976 RepID=A0A5R8QJH5_9FIRM|nr:50S ribosomal protein L3 [Culicoidibacter larvae]